MNFVLIGLAIVATGFGLLAVVSYLQMLSAHPRDHYKYRNRLIVSIIYGILLLALMLTLGTNGG